MTTTRIWTALVCVGAVACSSSSNGGSSGGNDAGSGRDATGDDGSASDGGMEAAVKTYCTSVTNAFFCADFDTPGSGPTDGFAGSSLTGGGSAALDTKSFVSAPASVTFTVVSGMGVDESAGANTMFRTFASSAAIGKQSFAFQLHLDPGCDPSATDAGLSGLDVAAISMGLSGDGSVTGGEIHLALLPGKTGIVEFGSDATSTDLGLTSHDVPALPTGRWVAVALTFDTTAKTVSIAYDGGAATTVPIQLLQGQEVNPTFGLTLQVGPSNLFRYIPACSLGFDNVVWSK